MSRSRDGGKSWGPATRIAGWRDRPFLAVDPHERQVPGPALLPHGRWSVHLNGPRTVVWPRDFAREKARLHTDWLRQRRDPLGRSPRRPLQWAPVRGGPGIGPCRSTTGVPRRACLSRRGSDFRQRTCDRRGPDCSPATAGRGGPGRQPLCGPAPRRLEVGPGRRWSRVLWTRSRDGGTRWEQPQVLSEQPNDSTDGKVKRILHSAYLPAMAVNKQGVVGVSWYDTRGLPVKQAGYTIRFRAYRRRHDLASERAGQHPHALDRVGEAPGSLSPRRRKATGRAGRGTPRAWRPMRTGASTRSGSTGGQVSARSTPQP